LTVEGSVEQVSL